MRISIRLLRALTEIACADSARDRINGILFRDGEIIATDGHRLIRVPHETDATFFMPRRLADAVCQATKYGDADVTVADGSIEVRAGGVRLSGLCGDVERFPPVDQVFESTSSGGDPKVACFNPRLLAIVADVTEGLGVDHAGIRIVACGGASDPMVFKTQRGGVVFALMPMRAGDASEEAAA